MAGVAFGAQLLTNKQSQNRLRVNLGQRVATGAGFVPSDCVALRRARTRDAFKKLRVEPAGFGLGDSLYVSVNLSARELEDSRLVSEVQAALSDSGLEPSRLVLEITETALMHDMQAALARLEALKGLGIRLSVDDFGTGYSSLSYLRQFPIDTVKIDKSFVDSIAAGRDDATFVGAILRLSEALHLDTLAEGIETGDQADTLQRLGCHLGQGFHYAKPLNPADVCDLLANSGCIVEEATRA
jgi:EAL domain-containing protein (putative c-di-GMP-specific phosphodiesterase class I)